ncbi:unnamed protein product [Amoebophrya sp. A25]|nr:unnamed protein product [Amoebophrya sp. A25]|eukprot:GSA25T00007493001.1
MTVMQCPAQETMENVQLPATMAGLKPYPEVCYMEGCHEMPNKSGDGGVKVTDMQPCYGDGCSICSIYCTFPACIGCSGADETCCSQCTYACCKVLDCSDAEKRCCTFVNCNHYLIVPRTCRQQTCQCCCVDGRQAFPCTKEVPCLINCLCCTCFANWGTSCQCCKTIGDLIPSLKE